MRLRGSRLAIIALFGVLAAFGSPYAASAQDGPIRLALRPVGQPGSYFDLVMLPGETRSLAVDIANDGAIALVARTYAADVYTIINGGFGARLRDEPRSGMTEWLDYSTQVLPLAAGSGVRRTLGIAVPGDAAPGEYITSLVLENDRPFSESGAIVLNQVVRQAVAVVVTVPGPRSPGLVIGAASHEVVAGISVVLVAIENTGNVRLKPLVSFALLDATGSEVSHASVQMDTFYAHTATLVQVQLAALLLPGAYTARLDVEDSGQRMQAVEADVPLIVAALRDSTGAAGVAPGLTDSIRSGGDGRIPLVIFGFVLVAGVLSSLGYLVLSRRAQRGSLRAKASER